VGKGSTAVSSRRAIQALPGRGWQCLRAPGCRREPRHLPSGRVCLLADSWRWGSDPVDLEQVVRRAIHTAGHDPHSKAATCDSQRETVARDLRPSVHTKKLANEPFGGRQASLMPATARGQLAVGRTPRQGNFDDPPTRKLLGRSPPTASAQLRTSITVQRHPPWTPVVTPIGGQPRER
jgi:hypothetical protein